MTFEPNPERKHTRGIRTRIPMQLLQTVNSGNPRLSGKRIEMERNFQSKLRKFHQAGRQYGPTGSEGRKKLLGQDKAVSAYAPTFVHEGVKTFDFKADFEDVKKISSHYGVSMITLKQAKTFKQPKHPKAPSQIVNKRKAKSIKPAIDYKELFERASSRYARYGEIPEDMKPTDVVNFSKTKAHDRFYRALLRRDDVKELNEGFADLKFDGSRGQDAIGMLGAGASKGDGPEFNVGGWKKCRLYEKLHGGYFPFMFKGRKNVTVIKEKGNVLYMCAQCGDCLTMVKPKLYQHTGLIDEMEKPESGIEAEEIMGDEAMPLPRSVLDIKLKEIPAVITAVRPLLDLVEKPKDGVHKSLEHTPLSDSILREAFDMIGGKGSRWEIRTDSFDVGNVDCRIYGNRNVPLLAQPLKVFSATASRAKDFSRKVIIMFVIPYLLGLCWATIDPLVIFWYLGFDVVYTSVGIIIYLFALKPKNRHILYSPELIQNVLADYQMGSVDSDVNKTVIQKMSRLAMINIPGPVHSQIIFGSSLLVRVINKRQSYFGAWAANPHCRRRPW